MNINIISIGKFNNSDFKQSFLTYINRINWQINLKELELRKHNNKSNSQITIAKEEELILKNLDKESYLIALDEKGIQFSSVEFSRFLQDRLLEAHKSIDFVIGGSNGLGKKILDKSQKKISLGKNCQCFCISINIVGTDITAASIEDVELNVM